MWHQAYPAAPDAAPATATLSEWIVFMVTRMPGPAMSLDQPSKRPCANPGMSAHLGSSGKRAIPPTHVPSCTTPCADADVKVSRLALALRVFCTPLANSLEGFT